MSRQTLLISNFTIDVLSGYLNNDASSPQIHSKVAGFEQVMPVLLDSHHPSWKESYDCVVVWTQPENVIVAFQDVIRLKSNSIDQLLNEVDQFARAILQAKTHVSRIFVPTWVAPYYRRDYQLNEGAKASDVIVQMNARLALNFKNESNVHILDTQKWLDAFGANAYSEKLWELGKIPFAQQVFKLAALDIKQVLNALEGQSKKLIIVDLDDTLWGGIVGDDGVEGIILGGQDPVGQALVAFQKALKELKNKGILLGVVSKNDESVALNAIKSHPEMILTVDDFAAWRINWNDKAQNVVDLVNELNIGLDSVVYIDDNPAERVRVKESLHDVLVPDWPSDKTLYAKQLQSMNCFDSVSLSEEDAKRTQMYIEERGRQQAKIEVGSLEQWLDSLDLKIDTEEFDESNVDRVVQLLNKTNQMNLTTRRMTKDELSKWIDQDNRKLWTMRVSDRFGDSGLTGIVSVEINNGVCSIVDFVLSCRVFGRKIEETMLKTVVDYAQLANAKEVKAKYIPTAKNKPCLQFFESSSFNKNSDNVFIRALTQEKILTHD